MGNFCSCGSTSMGTAKLVLLDGELKEFSSPVKVCNLLEENCDSFICNTDEMDFDELVTAIKGDEELQPGQLYFELPLSWLTQRLQAEDMASLAVKASAALTRADEMKCGCCGPRRVDPRLMFDGEEYGKVEAARPLMVGSHNRLGSMKKKGGTPSRVGNFNPGRFSAKLSVIYEEY